MCRIAGIAFALAAMHVLANTPAPVLRWGYGGCTSYCQTGRYSSPAVVDIDGDGQAEVIGGGGDVVVLNGATGALRYRDASSVRVWPDIAVGDLNHDGKLALVVGRRDGTVSAFNGDLSLRSGWPQTLFAGNEVRALALADLDGNGKLHVVAGGAWAISTGQVDVLAPNGSERAGWPRPQSGDPGYAAGIFNDDIAIGDLRRDGHVEIFVPTDTHYILGLNPDGNYIPANILFGVGKVWPEVGVWVDQAFDIIGYGDCVTPGIGLRPNFAASAPALGDVNGDGRLELAVVGNVYDCSVGNTPPPGGGDRYHLPWLFNEDRSRFAASGYDWSTEPAPSAGAAPLAEYDYALIQDAQPNAVLADLDGDGKLEILYSSYDGKVHAYWLDKTEHGNWPFAIPGTGIHFAAPPVAAELYHDGKAEVLVATWPQATTTETGKLYILDDLGNILTSADLPAPNGDTWNGTLASPTLALLPGSRNLAVVLMTRASGLVAFDLPGTEYARTLWPTGRGGYLRDGRAFNDRIFADGFRG